MEDFELDFDIADDVESVSLDEALSNNKENDSSEPKETDPEDSKPKNNNKEKEEEPSNEDEPVEEEDEDSVSDEPGTGVYSHLANALKEEGIIDVEDSFLKDVKDATSFKSLLDNHIQSQISERYKRIESAIENGLKVSDIQVYENQLDWLHNISEEQLSSEADEGFELRKRLIYQDFINKGYSDERARRELKKSLDAGTDIEDAKEALQDGIKFVNSLYNKEIEKVKQERETIEAQRKERAKEIEKDIIENDKAFGSLSVDKNTRKKIYDIMYRPTVKSAEGKMVSELSDFVKNNNTEAWKYLAYMYNATSKFTNFDGLFKAEVTKQVNKGIKNLENVINSSRRNSDGSINLNTEEPKENSFYNNNWELDL